MYNRLLTRLIVALAISLFTSGCKSHAVKDPYVLKPDKPSNHIITDPYAWARQQISETAPLGADGRLCSMEADIDGDGVKELFIRADIPASLFVILVLKKDNGGYTYLGSIDSHPDMIKITRQKQIITYQRSGGHSGAIVIYAMKSGRFKKVHTSGMLNVGDGGNAAHNKHLHALFNNCNHEWKKVPEKAIQN